MSGTERLTLWTLLGLCGAACFVYGGFASNWLVFGVGLVVTLAAQWMLGSGWFLRFPRSSS